MHFRLIWLILFSFTSNAYAVENLYDPASFAASVVRGITAMRANAVDNFYNLAPISAIVLFGTTASAASIATAVCASPQPYCDMSNSTEYRQLIACQRNSASCVTESVCFGANCDKGLSYCKDESGNYRPASMRLQACFAPAMYVATSAGTATALSLIVFIVQSVRKMYPCCIDSIPKL